MRKVLITGGTVFVSRFAAAYYVAQGDDVYVLNRNSRTQVEGVTLIEADRHHLGDCLKAYSFDVVLDVSAYTEEDVRCLIEALRTIKEYVFISSGAVYPETLPQPFAEDQPVGRNAVWQDYGLHKQEAEDYLRKHVPQAYILRPPYLYGPLQNLYREPFVFDCAMQKRPFYIPKDGRMPLQFFHVQDLCRFIDILLREKPEEHLFNVGNPQVTDINEWVAMCYEIAGSELKTVYVDGEITQRDYFCFYDYEYRLDVTRQRQWMPDTTPLRKGLQESFEWYCENQSEVRKRDYIGYIDENLSSLADMP